MNQSLQKLVQEAWSGVVPPSSEDMSIMLRGWGELSARAFVGVAPMDVDTDSAGFHAATPLFDLPSTASAAYLGTFLIALLKSLEFQRGSGLFDDLVTRPHTLTFLMGPRLRAQVLGELDTECRHALAAVARYLATYEAVALKLTSQQQERLRQLAELAER